MADASSPSTRRRVRIAAVLLTGSVVGVTVLGCRDAPTATGPRGPSEPEPRAGRYRVAEFAFQNSCAQPAFALSSLEATTHSVTFEFTPEAGDRGTVALDGVLEVVHPTEGAAGIVIFEGPDTGVYHIAGDTLRLMFPRGTNEWLGVLRFPQYRGGQLAGASSTSCRALWLRLERSL
jgi:hypothetical protein